MASNINAITTGAGGLSTTADASGNINLQSNGTTVLGVTSGGVAVTGTMTVGGNAVLTSTSSVSASSITGTLPIANGGTNNASLGVTAGGVVYTDGSKLANVGAGTSGQVLQSNGASAPTWVNASAGGLGGITVFTANGTFTIPSGKTVVKATIVGGGGSILAITLNPGCCSGGGGGGTAVKYLTGLTPGNTLTVTVAGTTAIGNSGGTSSVASGTQTITTVSATGGTVGNRITSSGNVFRSVGAVNGGSGSGGDVNFTGSRGQASSMDNSCFTYAQAGNGGDSLLSGTTTPSSYLWAPGGTSIDPTAGVLYGAGASGSVCISTNTAGATGGAGIVIFEY